MVDKDSVNKLRFSISVIELTQICVDVLCFVDDIHDVHHITRFRVEFKIVLFVEDGKIFVQEGCKVLESYDAFEITGFAELADPLVSLGKDKFRIDDIKVVDPIPVGCFASKLSNCGKDVHHTRKVQHNIHDEKQILLFQIILWGIWSVDDLDLSLLLVKVFHCGFFVWLIDLGLLQSLSLFRDSGFRLKQRQKLPSCNSTSIRVPNCPMRRYKPH
mmetsp:Transcript_6600/g.14985  ORF Transcript_6600/g.14985 Transcript_6600/m.14985 type:complete len:216 (-) Transcript_6600:384-1031(-)